MNIADIIIALLAIGIVGGIIAYRVVQRKKGKPVGCSGCAGCQSKHCPSDTPSE